METVIRDLNTTSAGELFYILYIIAFIIIGKQMIIRKQVIPIWDTVIYIKLHFQQNYVKHYIEEISQEEVGLRIKDSLKIEIETIINREPNN